MIFEELCAMRKMPINLPLSEGDPKTAIFSASPEVIPEVFLHLANKYQFRADTPMP